ncbi:MULTISPECIES: prepilin-type N-terminal cleavage/methylation domain-containing protein [unclassified Lentimonas]|uniref:prepilin-type N-terminal cleavage/methylation domain-containing protein n=1 Tax=unclassified Lentimonas TaxID=2630993 RepID=UPI001328CDA9|nr:MULTISPECIES: prepilin-type N-terminal cleavage/methylation domain-containing protein [unclassified Lentimonas]CAA6676435.1 Unannotated [Lentimonas sp. CC4]CAA6685274.1 Unannotated [Lentimonas sp. CC6]CAA6690338.1 Unannotated [Lentimonas sp. CC10]CAA6693056.1 Unannotated [Lentimonas sp. CC19]CAA7069037.1 Unannotated [Lentimonas sp. CC11]
MRINKQKSGFTLVELMVASAISLMVLTGLLGTVLTMGKTMKVSMDETSATSDNLKIQQILESELRGVSEVLTQTATDFMFVTTDIAGNTDTIIYTVSGSGDSLELKRNELTGANVAEVLLSAQDDGLSAVTFEYYTQMGTVAVTAAGTNAVKITLERSVDGHFSDISKDIDITMVMFRNKSYTNVE